MTWALPYSKLWAALLLPIALGAVLRQIESKKWILWCRFRRTFMKNDIKGTQYEGDDVIILADSFDTTAHNQDGYGVYGAERVIYNFTFFDFFGDAPNHLRDKCFVAVKPKA